MQLLDTHPPFSTASRMMRTAGAALSVIVSVAATAHAQYAPPGSGVQAPYQQQGNNPSARVGRLAALVNGVSIEPNGVANWSQAEPNYPIATGDRVYTDQNARAEISIGSMVARMSGAADLTMTNLSDTLVQMGLAQGSVHIRIYDIPYGNQVEIDTPNGAVTLNQPGDVRIDVPAQDGATIVSVDSGNVVVSGPGTSENIQQGTAVELTGTNPVYLSAVQFPERDHFDNWSYDRDRHILNARSAQYVSRDMPGFDDLDDYGRWQPDTEYGPVWYPNNVEAGYVPYQNGHWVWVDPYGWTWVDAAPWGYAPFHYGRWAYIGDRWGWIPGPVRVRPYWAPALVAFAGGAGFGVQFGGGAGFAAWFPLGVGEPYVPSYHCGPDYVRNVNVTNINITNIHNTTIVNNYNTFVSNTNNYTNIRNVTMNYQNRDRGFTAVNGRAFSSGQMVRNSIARIPPNLVQGATVIAHPNLLPTRQSLVPHPVMTRLPVSATRPTLVTRTGQEQQATPGAPRTAVPYRPLPPGPQRGNPVQPIARPVPGAPTPAQPAGGRLLPPPAPGITPRQNTPPALQPPANQRPLPPPVAQRPLPPPAGRPVAAPLQPAPVRQPFAGTPAPRPLINRNETPAPQPTFQQQRPAMRTDPGRPLEPQQRDNLQQGRPAGRPMDVETLPHQQPAPARLAPPVRSATPPPPAPARQESHPAPQPAPRQELRPPVRPNGH